jgi:hypothetical protein
MRSDGFRKASTWQDLRHHTHPRIATLSACGRRSKEGRELTLLVGILEGEGGGGAVLPRLGAKVVVEAGAGGHGLGVEVGGERAVLRTACQYTARVSKRASTDTAPRPTFPRSKLARHNVAREFHRRARALP